MNEVRLGCVKYLNTLPLVNGLEKWRQAGLVFAAPSHLAGLLAEQRVDVALISAIDLARSEGRLAALPAGMIGCDGATFTVRLFSKRKFEELTTVYVDAESHTSAALVRVLVKRKFWGQPRFVEYDARERVPVAGEAGGAGEPGAGFDADGWPEAVMLIGDKVVTDPPPAHVYRHQLDLGAAWKELTGLPFVYAVWACRAEEAGSVGVRAAMMMLDRARRHNATRLDALAAAAAPGRGWPIDLAADYLGSKLRFDVTDEHRRGLARFLKEAADLGLAPADAAERVVWAELEPESAPAGAGEGVAGSARRD